MRKAQRPIELALERNWRRLFGYALTLTGDADNARDLIQQSALNALATQNIPGDAKAIRAWLFRIVRNSWIDQYRRNKIRADDGLVDDLQIGGWGYDDRVIAEITVRQGLGKIDPVYREMIELVDICGFQYADVAAVLDIPVGTVMSRLSRARLSLLEAVADDNVRPIRSLRGKQK
ncbi:MAG: RNA polymerase sigma factor [Bradyrhizobium sp.]|nr:RNA polymerase sigma factor [Bradyrhizobium sp.]